MKATGFDPVVASKGHPVDRGRGDGEGTRPGSEGRGDGGSRGAPEWYRVGGKLCTPNTPRPPSPGRERDLWSSRPRGPVRAQARVGRRVRRGGEGGGGARPALCSERMNPTPPSSLSFDL